ncbi:selenium-dependent molybdenum cofactor biosynthesis protein YqeB [Sporomusa termitida]|uniref:Selenium-dependent molybdenum hydroxylase system protein, YqeB family n=1 Tax=Sporomusa termitida TaxID=2377 RepID=A0A517DY73_9FIRM|nr:selenium-dependent molybdenum cofactor biosynthesis protein YqeB [Sporomusa termitida]QDR82186.1 selenium-dependent molybdenum hydroxylase system protein, YqeB family [Sporomusa termitida]
MNKLIVIKGGGDLATGIAHRLYKSRFNIVITELPRPTVVRRTVAFAQAVVDGEAVVEGVTARRVTAEAIGPTLAAGCIPVVVDAVARYVSVLRPQAVVDAIIAKRNTGTMLTDAPVVIGVGPGFTAPVDVHAVIETMRGHDLGRVIYQKTAIANTGIPGEVGGYTRERLIKAPVAGEFTGCREIGATVQAGEIVGYVGGVPVAVAITGVLRGLIQSGLTVTKGLKIGDVDPRCRPEHCYTVSDKARAIGGGVLEALLHLGASP